MRNPLKRNPDAGPRPIRGERLAATKRKAAPLSADVPPPRIIAPGGPVSHALAITQRRKNLKLPITAEVLGHVLAGAFIALNLSAPQLRLESEKWLIDTANRLSDLGLLAADGDPAVAASLCAASRALMQTEV